MASSFVLKSAGLLVHLGGKFLKSTQLVSGQGSITGVKYREKCWTSKQCWWCKLASGNFSSVACFFLLLKHLSDFFFFSNFCELQADGRAVGWRGGIQWAAKKCHVSCGNVKILESRELDAVLFFTFPFPRNPHSGNGITSPDHQRWVLQQKHLGLWKYPRTWYPFVTHHKMDLCDFQGIVQGCHYIM